MEASRRLRKVMRAALLVFWAVWQSMVVRLLIEILQEHVLNQKWTMLLLMSAVCSAVIGLLLSMIPEIVLDERGIYTQILFQRRFCPWNHVQQAGILYRMGNGMRYNEIVLLKANGSPRRYSDKTFLLRNFGRVIRIPFTEETKQYVISHYGPLDFDLSDGRSEQSIVSY